MPATGPAQEASDPLNAGELSLRRLGAAMFLTSVGASLFSLLIFRLLSFFIMPSIFFSLLLVAFPIGAALAARRPIADARRFQTLLLALQSVMILSLFATLLCRHVDYMRAQLLFGVNPTRLLLQILTFALIYFPFFITYGAAEYVGYLTGTAAFGQRMRPVYGLFLFGGAAAFLVVGCVQRSLGVPRLLVGAVAAVAAARLVLASRRCWRNGIELAGLAAVICWPGFDALFMGLFKASDSVYGSTAFSRKLARQNERLTGDFGNYKVVLSEWGRYSYLEMVSIKLPGQAMTQAFYNDVGMWSFFAIDVPPGSDNSDVATRISTVRDRVAFLFAPQENGSVCVIGAGGGRDVMEARQAGFKRILALELEPGVVDAVQGPLRETFHEVYSRPPVEVRACEARGYLERIDERFDLLMLMSVGSYPQLMLEPGDIIRTIEAFRLFVSRISDRGVLVIAYDSVLDKQGVLLRQYHETLRLLGMHSVAFYDRSEQYVLVAHRTDAPAAQIAEWERAIGQLSRGASRLSDEDMRLADFRAITDDRPFFAGNISNILSVSQLLRIAAILFALVAEAGLILAVILGRRLRIQGRRGSSIPLLVMAVLIGINFMLIEELCVIRLFRHMYCYYDSLMAGVVAFLALSGLGSLLLSTRILSTLLALAIVPAVLSCWAPPGWGSAAALAALAPLVLVTGSLFPALFDKVPAARLAMFAMDAIGAAIGGLLSFFVPILFGFQVFEGLALFLFALTGIGLVLFLRRHDSSETGQLAA